MSTIYDFALVGAATPKQVEELSKAIQIVVQGLGLELGVEVGWAVKPAQFSPDEAKASALLYFGGEAGTESFVRAATQQAIPIVPVVSRMDRVQLELPEELWALNAIEYDAAGAERIASALLESAGLLPRQRRVFISYRRDESRVAALQLLGELAARHYEVFIDTHAIQPGEDFQAVLWDRLCDSDALIMLDTATYFGSRWTSAEFGRALAKGIPILRIGWPTVQASPRTAIATHIDLAAADISSDDSTICSNAISRICLSLEALRSLSTAVRRRNFASKIELGVKAIGGSVDGFGKGGSIHVRLPSGKPLVAHPALGVPTARTLHRARQLSPGEDVVVVYDHVGLSASSIEHLDWIGEHVATPKWIKLYEASWRLADWEVAK